MPSTYSSLLRLEMVATGEQSGTWGITNNTNLGTLIESAIAGFKTVAMTDANYTLTALNGADDEARSMGLNITGTLTAARNIVCPTSSKLYIVKNATSGGYAITLKTSGGSGISVANGTLAVLFCDGTNVVNVAVGALFNGAALGTPASGDLRNCSLAVAPAIGGTTPAAGTFTSLAATTFTVPSGTGSTTEGVMQWSTAGDLLTVGTGAATKTMVDTNSTQTVSGKTLTSPTINTTASVGGTWSAAAAWTLPAYTLGGTVTLNGQSFSGTCANGGTFTTIDINGGTVDGTAIGGASASTGAFTTLSASSTVSGAGFSNYLASPPAIGGTAPAAGTFTSLTATTFTIPSGTGSTTEGVMQWSAAGDVLTVGTGAATKTMVDTNSTQTLSGKTLSSPTLTTPALGTPASGTLTSCTGLPISTGISGLGTGVATALAVNVGSAGAPVVNGGALGTPSSGTLTNCSGLPQAGVTGLTTADSPRFAAVNIGHASDTTLTRVSAGTLAVGGVNILTTATGAGAATYTTATTPIPAAGTVITAAHGLGVTPVDAELEFTCITADGNYATGDVVNVSSFWNGGVPSPATLYKNSTTVGLTLYSGYDYVLQNKTTGANFTPTKANWSYRFKLRVM